MSAKNERWWLRVAGPVALLVSVSFGLSAVYADDIRGIKVFGSGEAVAAPYVTYDFLEEGTRNIGSDLTADGGQDTTGHAFTYAVNAIADEDGNAEGLMRIFDRELDVMIEATVISVDLHPTTGAPTGFRGRSVRMIGETTAPVVVGGIRFPAGTKVANSPTFDSGRNQTHSGDTICFELFDTEGVKIYQWSAFVSGGNVQIEYDANN